MRTPLHVESAVRARYSEAAGKRVDALCCPTEYDREYLKVIPAEVLERDYGCGDPSRYLRPGETVLDLGSGAGKICFIAAQVVGREGSVIGVDMNDEMLALARKSAPAVGNALGYHNVRFCKGRIQDLALDLEKLDADLKARSITDAQSFLSAELRADELRATAPMIADASMDVVVSNCVLNLVQPRAKRQLFDEIFRVLRPGGRAVISDIVSGSPVPAEMQNDPELWSGCISGALTEEGFIEAFTVAGFHGTRILKRDQQPWRTVNGIEFRSMTIEAFKAPPERSGSATRTVIYKGPFREVVDDNGRRMERGRKYAVTDEACALYGKEPYVGSFEIADADGASAQQEKPTPFAPARHPAREAKGQRLTFNEERSTCCEGGGCC